MAEGKRDGKGTETVFSLFFVAGKKRRLQTSELTRPCNRTGIVSLKTTLGFFGGFMTFSKSKYRFWIRRLRLIFCTRHTVTRQRCKGFPEDERAECVLTPISESANVASFSPWSCSSSALTQQPSGHPARAYQQSNRGLVFETRRLTPPHTALLPLTEMDKAKHPDRFRHSMKRERKKKTKGKRLDDFV